MESLVADVNSYTVCNFKESGMEVKTQYLIALEADPTEQLPMLVSTGAQALTETARFVLETAVPRAIGYDPLNSADKLEPDDRFFLVDVIADEARKEKMREVSGVPKHALDWIEVFCN